MCNVNLKCPQCGAEEFKVGGRDGRPDGHLTCVACGFADSEERLVDSQVGDKALEFAADELTKLLKQSELDR